MYLLVLVWCFFPDLDQVKFVAGLSLVQDLKLFPGSLVSASACLQVYAYRGLQPAQVLFDIIINCVSCYKTNQHTSLNPH